MWQNRLIARLCNAALAVKMAQHDDTAQRKMRASQTDQPLTGQTGQPPTQTQPPTGQSGQQQAQPPAGPVVQQPPVAQVYGPQRPQYLDTSVALPQQRPQVVQQPAAAQVGERADIAQEGPGFLANQPFATTSIKYKGKDVTATINRDGSVYIPEWRTYLDPHGYPITRPSVEQTDFRPFHDPVRDITERFTRYHQTRPAWEIAPYFEESGYVPDWADTSYSRERTHNRLKLVERGVGPTATVDDVLTALSHYHQQKHGPFTVVYDDQQRIDKRAIGLGAAQAIIDSMERNKGWIAFEGVTSLSLKKGLQKWARDLPFDSRLTDTLDSAIVPRPVSRPGKFISNSEADAIIQTMYTAPNYPWELINNRFYPIINTVNGSRLLTRPNNHGIIRFVNSLPSELAGNAVLPNDTARNRYKILAPWLEAAANTKLAEAAKASPGYADKIRKEDPSKLAHRLLLVQDCISRMYNPALPTSADQLDAFAETSWSIADVEHSENESIKKHGKGFLAVLNEMTRDARWGYDPVFKLFIPVSGHLNFHVGGGKYIAVPVDDIVNVNKADAELRSEAIEIIALLNRLPTPVREFVVQRPDDLRMEVTFNNFMRRYPDVNKEGKYRYDTLLRWQTINYLNYFNKHPELQEAEAQKIIDDFVGFCAAMPAPMKRMWYAAVAMSTDFYFAYEDGNWTASYPLSGVIPYGYDKEGNLIRVSQEEIKNRAGNARMLIERLLNAAPPIVQQMMIAAPAINKTRSFNKLLNEAKREYYHAMFWAVSEALNIALFGTFALLTAGLGGITLGPMLRESLKRGGAAFAKQLLKELAVEAGRKSLHGLVFLIPAIAKDPRTWLQIASAATGDDLEARIASIVAGDRIKNDEERIEKLLFGR